MGRIDALSRSAMADAHVDRTDLGAGTSTLLIYTGTAPAGIGDAAAGTLLVTFNLPNPAFGAAATGVATLLGVPIAAVGAAAGTAGYARLVNRDGLTIYDTESVGTAATEVIMSTTTVSIGLDVNLNSMTMTVGAGAV